MKLAALAILAITACGRAHDGPTVSPELQPYVTEFLSECDSRGFADQCRVRLGQMEAVQVASLVGDDQGGCFFETGTGTPHHIDVSAALSPELKRVISYHELAHCLLGMEHRDGPLTAEWMDMAAGSWDQETWTRAVDDLFQPSL
jgi:hypothetical protein